MRGNKKARRLLAALVIALLASLTAAPALADETPVSERDALEQGVVLYEKMLGKEIEVPEQLVSGGYDEIFVKAAAMGYVNLDDYDSTAYNEYIRKQDFMNILYKTIITYNPDYAINSEEAEQILNDCYDNAYLDEENRTAYAFMIKSGFILDTVNSEPDAELSWDSCAILVEQVYNMFVSDVAVNVSGVEIREGGNISSVIDALGMPNRIDESDYGFDWYVYNGNYADFVMIGVDGDRICAFFTNGQSFDYKGIKSGDDFAKASQYVNGHLRFITDADDKVDAVWYNPRGKETNPSVDAEYARGAELLDMINANRVKNGRMIYTGNEELDSEAVLSAAGVAADPGSVVTSESEYDIYLIYSNLVRSGNDIISGESQFIAPMGVSVSVDLNDDYAVTAQLVTNDSAVAGIKAMPREAVPVKEERVVEPVDEVTTPVISVPTEETLYDGAEDVVIELAMRAASQYHIEVFDYENDDYVVNKYVTTGDTSFVLPAGLFTRGRDYKIIVSALDDSGTALSSEPVMISYGADYENAVRITAPYDEGVTDDDSLSVAWESDIYSDFFVDVYNANDNLVVSQIVENDNKAVIRGIDPGEYYLYITALRKGTAVEKAQDMVHFTVKQPEPVITEIILEPDEVYNFVYEDEDLGVLYFYDEDIVEVEEDGETVQRKKIIQKQVKATKAYKKLASYISRKASTTGAPFVSSGASTQIGNAIVAEAEKYLGVPYVWGGASPDGFDCSGLVQYVCESLGISVNRVAEDQFRNGEPVNRDELMPGDLVFFEEDGYIHHVGIYVGDNTMIHAPHTGDVIRYASLDSEYYSREYAGARRVY